MNRTFRPRSIQEMLREPRLIAGGADNPTNYPLAAPTISGNLITVDSMLKQPTRVTRFIMDITQQKFIIDRLFTSAGGVTGGAVVYDQATENELYTDRDVEPVEPGMEFPLISGHRGAPKLAKVEKWGGKDFITDEARDRNDQAGFQNKLRQLGNTIVKKINAYAVGVLEAAIAEHTQTMPGNDWSVVLLEGNAPTANADRPTADIAAAHLLAEEQELGVKFDTLIVNPQEKANLVIAYGDKLPAVLKAMEIEEMYSSNRVTAGSAYLAAAKQVGEMRIEKPLGTEAWREEKTERNWFQSSVRPLAYVTNPFAVLKLTGLAG